MTGRVARCALAFPLVAHAPIVDFAEHSAPPPQQNSMAPAINVDHVAWGRPFVS